MIVSSEEEKNIKKQAIRSVKWSALIEIVSRLSTPLVTIIMTRLLSPSDFGVVATATIAISFVQLFWGTGLGKALIQTDDSAEETSYIVFWTNFGLGCLTYLLLFLLSPWLALFFNSPTSENVLKVLGLQLIIISLTSVQQSLFVREFNFRKLFLIKLLTSFIPGITSVILALSGYGVWSLVFGNLTGCFLNLILLWIYSPWKPKFRYNFLLARKIFRFGFWVMAEGFGGWLIMWGDNLAIGKFLGVAQLGVYQTGWAIVMAIFGIILNPFLPILFPSFSRLQKNLPALISNFHKVNRVIITLVLPVGTGLFLVGEEMANIFFKDNWQGLGLVISILGLMTGLSWLAGANPEFYRAIGKPATNAKLVMVLALCYFPVFIFASQYDLSFFTYVRLGLTVITIPCQIFVAVKFFNFPLLYLWNEGKMAFLSTLSMILSVLLAKNILFYTNYLPILKLMIEVLCGGSVYFLVFYLLDKEFVVQTINIIKQITKKTKGSS